MKGPQAVLTDGEVRLAAVRDLVGLIGRDLRRLHSAPELAYRHFAALGLARSARLIEGMQLLIGEGYVDMVGVLARSCIEVYAVSMYSMYGRQEAYDHIRGAHVRNVSLLPDVEDLREARRLAERWDGPTDKINREQLIKRDLPSVIPDPNPVSSFKWHEALYDVTYRKYSNSDVHAGVGALGADMVRKRQSLGVDAVRYSPDDGTMDLILVGCLLGILATNVYEVFGVNHVPVEDLLSRIAYSMRAEDFVIIGDWD